MRILLLFFLFWCIAQSGHAVDIETGIKPANGLINSGNTIMTLLTYGEKILLTLVLPLTIVGVGLYIAYELMTAEGDEEKMKKAFKSMTYGGIGLIAIGCAYAFVHIISTLSF